MLRSIGVVILSLAMLLASSAAVLETGSGRAEAGASLHPAVVSLAGDRDAPMRQEAELTISLGSNDKLGAFLTDGAGMTLYYYALDVAGDSRCTDRCLTIWPAFFAADIVVPPDLDPADFGSIMRVDGASQTTFKGWPLYYFARDAASGDTLGEGVGNVWFVMPIPAYTVMIANQPDVKSYLVDIDGRSLYTFANDTPGTSNCTDQCAVIWPPFSPANLVVPSLLDPADLQVIGRPDGTSQMAYQSQPLYYYAPDQSRGDTRGQGVGGVWFVASAPSPPPAAAPTATPPQAAPVSPTPTSSAAPPPPPPPPPSEPY